MTAVNQITMSLDHLMSMVLCGWLRMALSGMKECKKQFDKSWFRQSASKSDGQTKPEHPAAKCVHGGDHWIFHLSSCRVSIIFIEC